MRVHGELRDHRTIRCRQIETDRTVRRGGHIHHLPGVIAIPQQERLGDLLHVGGGQRAVFLPVDQREIPHHLMPAMPAMRLHARMVVSPSAHPVVPRRRRTVDLLGGRRCGLRL